MFSGLVAQWQRTSSGFADGIAPPWEETAGWAKTCTTKGDGPPVVAGRTRDSISKAKPSADMAIQCLGDLVLGNRTDNLLNHLPVLEDQQRGDAANAITGGGVHRLVHVQLGYLELARVVLGDFRNGGRQHVARAAPLRPEIDHNGLRLAGGQHLGVEVSVVHGKNIISHVVMYPL